MPVYFQYALKASICLAIIFLFYNLLLKQITWYIWNRYFLLIFSVFSCVVPFININVFVKATQLEHLKFVGKLPNIVNSKISLNFVDSYLSFNYWQLLSGVYIFVGSLLCVRLLIQILSIQKIKSKATLTHKGEVEIYHLSKPVLPFSFLNSIFINKNNYSDHELQEIVDHERVHVQQKHTIDVLIAEMICIVNWYNPFAWLIKKAVRENLEFIADDAVIQKGVDRKSYQYLLLKVTGDIPFTITNNLKFSSLKSRILMMNKTKTGKFHLVKFALLVPVITFLLFAFTNKHEIYSIVKEQNTITKTYLLSSLTYFIPDKKVEALVKNEKENCLLKTGEALNLENVFNEKARLQNLLQKNGYNNIGAHAITFMIDTTLGNNSFSVQVNINLAKNELSKNKESGLEENTPVSNINSPEKSMQSFDKNSPDYRSNVSGDEELNNKLSVFDNKMDAFK